MLSLRPLHVLFASSILALLPSAQSGSSTTSVLLTPPSSTQFANGDDLEGDLNCDEVVFARLGLRSIVQNVPAMGPEFAASMRSRAKILTLAAVVASQSVLHGYLERGLLAGLEFDWFFPHGAEAPTSYRLPGVVEAYVLGPDGEPRLVARIYGYDTQQYAKRRAVVQMMITHPMRVYPVWTEDVVTASGSPECMLAISGMGNAFHGRSVVADALFLTGLNNALLDGLLVGGESVVQARNQVGPVLHGDFATAPAVPFSETSARNLARASGHYFSGDVSLDAEDLPAAGLVFAEGTLRVNASGFSGRVTFVSASGAVHLSGEGDSLRPYLADVLAISFAQKVIVSGDGNAFLGELHAPQGSVEVPGSGNTLVGILAGRSVCVSGSRNVISDGTHPTALP
jgi:hypothetical protein